MEGGGERGGSGAADDGAESSIAADHARGCGVGGRRERGMGEGEALGKPCGGFWGEPRWVGERLLLLRRAVATAFGLVWFGLCLAWLRGNQRRWWAGGGVGSMSTLFS